MRTKVGVIFGGMSVEHEVSVISASQAMSAIDKDKYEVVPIYISKDRAWYTGEQLTNIEEYKDLKGLLSNVQKIQLQRDPNGKFLLQKDPQPKFGKKYVDEIDVAFPVMHGTYGEDGVLQGFLELLGIPYVGPDVLASAAGMDKSLMKSVVRDYNIPILDFISLYSSEWRVNQEEVTARIEKELGFPVIVKPANLGSSVGISKAADVNELEDAIDLATSFAAKIVIEKMVTNMKEVNCSVLGDYEHAEASICERVLGNDEFLSYEDKYQSSSSSKGAKGMEATNRIIPADISDEQTAEVQAIAVKAFQVLGCSGVSRIDFIIDLDDNEKVYINEINTIPGSLSFYLWEPTGKSFSDLTNDLIKLALKRERERENLTFSIDSNLFNTQSGGLKGSKN
ncbi:D-alanine--D-alanine ligase family protein [Alkalihalobacillus deserti]|uniref:D-alanine--D-alanine ligase family protein n=1 Tax=Alkalihalobacillus deserti TaxID=2879466 RepID=UPI001D1374DA|nr:D-alanine--D-alanine ligase family protein [Alkalihalobacillus deserti]